jgi:predicted pyridoxine 5'-phosphate oxidase superfamily flavin-nucleotide-binding protein
MIPEKARVLLGQELIIALATSDRKGKPNVVPMLQYWLRGEDELVVGDLFMKATRRNVEENGLASITAWDEETGESYKYCGTARYETAGEALDFANERLHRKKPEKDFKGVVVVKVTEVYIATRGKRAGEKIAG